MSLNRWDARRDANEKEIVDTFEALGITVFRLDRPLDLLIGYKRKNYLVEVKVLGKKLNNKQKEFVSWWKGQHFVCYTVDQALKFGREIIKNER